MGLQYLAEKVTCNLNRLMFVSVACKLLCAKQTARVEQLVHRHALQTANNDKLLALNGKSMAVVMRHDNS